jgi:hypothetical protein
MQKWPGPVDWMTDSIMETHSTSYPGLSGSQRGKVERLGRPDR